ncbi:unnamed protein product [Prorocentrum cordatum]|uniref:Uncharacterized protein n=1 Tax=Prorocentrum cordatum TaxID=2364126 RepID=A0ABN9QA33_9DINO|nr:unnamed protein product [Polarella glacialis]
MAATALHTSVTVSSGTDPITRPSEAFTSPRASREAASLSLAPTPRMPSRWASRGRLEQHGFGLRTHRGHLVDELRRPVCLERPRGPQAPGGCTSPREEKEAEEEEEEEEEDLARS